MTDDLESIKREVRRAMEDSDDGDIPAAARLIQAARRGRDEVLAQLLRKADELDEAITYTDTLTAERDDWHKVADSRAGELVRVMAERDAARAALDEQMELHTRALDLVELRTTERDAALRERDELADLVGQAICAFTLRDGETLAEPKRHALIAGALDLVQERDAALARVRELEADLDAEVERRAVLQDEMQEDINDLMASERKRQEVIDHLRAQLAEAQKAGAELKQGIGLILATAQADVRQLTDTDANARLRLRFEQLRIEASMYDVSKVDILGELHAALAPESKEGE